MAKGKSRLNVLFIAQVCYTYLFICNLHLVFVWFGRKLGKEIKDGRAYMLLLTTITISSLLISLLNILGVVYL